MKKYARYDSDGVGSFLLLCKVRFPPNIFGGLSIRTITLFAGYNMRGFDLDLRTYLDDLRKNNEIEMSFKISLWFSAA